MKGTGQSPQKQADIGNSLKTLAFKFLNIGNSPSSCHEFSTSKTDGEIARPLTRVV